MSAPAPRVVFLGRAPYREVWARQEAARAALIAASAGAGAGAGAGADPSLDAGTLFFCEHDPVITLGRSAAPEHLKVPRAELVARGIDVVETSRGGDVTAHGPGQLVIYPVVRLPRGVLAHVTGTGQAIADELVAMGLTRAHFRRDPVGVFVGEAKIAACGVHVSRRVAIHGWALNVTRAILPIFTRIVPCGLAGVPLTTIEDELGGAPPELEALARALAPRLVRALSAG